MGRQVNITEATTVDVNRESVAASLIGPAAIESFLSPAPSDTCSPAPSPVNEIIVPANALASVVDNEIVFPSTTLT